MERSPFFRDVILSVGGWNWAVWKDGEKVRVSESVIVYIISPSCHTCPCRMDLCSPLPVPLYPTQVEPGPQLDLVTFNYFSLSLLICLNNLFSVTL